MNINMTPLLTMSSITTPISSICLPQVLPETSKEAIRRVLEDELKLGHIVTIDMVPRTNSGETCLIGSHDKFLVFVHLSWNLTNPEAEQMSRILLGGGQVKIFYMQNRFWWVRKSTSDASQGKAGGTKVELPPEQIVPDSLTSVSAPDEKGELIEFPVYHDPSPYTSNFIPSTMNQEEVIREIERALSNMAGVTYKSGKSLGKWECTWKEYLTTTFEVCLWKYKSIFLVESNYISGDRSPFVRIHNNMMTHMGFRDKLTFEKAVERSKTSLENNSHGMLYALRRETSQPDNYIS